MSNFRRGNALETTPKHGQDLVDVLVDRELVMEHPPHHATLVDHKGDSLVEPDDGARGAIGLADLLVLIADHREARLGLLGEAALRLVAVAADADDLAAELLDFGVCSAKLRRPPCSPAGKCL